MAQTPPSTNILKAEPAVAISTITALLTALIGFGAAFGLNLSDDQKNAVIGCVAPAVAVIFLLGPIVRAFVYSPESTQKLVNAAESAGAKGETAPVTPV
jgi:hypothetical protein